MTKSSAPLEISAISSRFSELLVAAGTSLENPTLDATWSAFAQFCTEAVDCDDEKLFFEAEMSTTHTDSFYVHFSRTCYGRRPKGHVWSYEIICDFLFPLDSSLEEFGVTFEAEEITSESDEGELFLVDVKSQKSLWHALAGREASSAEIYIGES
jgi:hypothetical protein